jgi:hypothetical protein
MEREVGWESVLAGGVMEEEFCQCIVPCSPGAGSVLPGPQRRLL